MLFVKSILQNFLLVFTGLVLFCNLAWAQTNEINGRFNLNDDFFEKELNIDELKQIIEQFDTYDYVRTQGQREELIRHLINESERLNYDLGIAQTRNLLGVMLRDRAEYAKAIEMHESALAHSKNDTIQNIYSLNNLGVVYRRLDQPRMALDYHMQALQLAEQFHSDPIIAKRSICVSLNSIGNINLAMNQPEKALEVFSQTLIIEESLDNRLGMAINYQNIGYAYEALGKPDVALTYYKKSLQQNEIINSDLGQSICYNSIGEILLKQDKTMEALRNFKMAMVFAQRNNDNYYISQTHANIGRVYLKNGNLDKAIDELDEYHNLATQIGSAYLVQDSYKLLSDYYSFKGDYQKALALFKTSVAYNDSIVNEKNVRYLNELQTLYEADKKEQQIEMLTVENKVKTQRNFFYLLGVVLLILLAFVLNIANKRRSEKLKTELESKLFRSLMNPHFIFNALGSIQSFLYQNEAEKAAAYLGNFSKLTRSILTNSSKELVTLEEEIEALRNYVEIEQMRKRDCFKFVLHIDENVETDFVYVLPTMLQPFVENAIHHGMKNLDCSQGLIEIGIKQFDKYVQIIISDNGPGIKASIETQPSHPNHKSMGMNIFKERIRLFEKKYKKTVKFAIDDLSDRDASSTGTMVKIEFPLIEPND
ncbi:MAG: tetratricopeptide repeat protein [Prolixibacteraceae bacterium]|nr:tetratricopeptide repeat protein [Prolixibacteraceae bacterium]